MDAHLPPATVARLFAFQREGVAFLARTGCRALLADEMGLGKTVQVGRGAGGRIGVDV
jgi:SNF2 family DNA or RNA helicase